MGWLGVRRGQEMGFDVGFRLGFWMRWGFGVFGYWKWVGWEEDGVWLSVETESEGSVGVSGLQKGGWVFGSGMVVGLVGCDGIPVVGLGDGYRDR